MFSHLLGLQFILVLLGARRSNCRDISHCLWALREDGDVSEDWKTYAHTHLNTFRKGWKKLSGNYRPAFQAPVLRKILGKIRTLKKIKRWAIASIYLSRTYNVRPIYFWKTASDLVDRKKPVDFTFLVAIVHRSIQTEQAPHVMAIVFSSLIIIKQVHALPPPCQATSVCNV